MNHPHSPIAASDVPPTNRSRSYIERLGAEIAAKLNYRPGQELEPIVARLGGRIEVQSWHSPTENGAIDVRGPKDFTIFLSPFTGPFRNRFTIAHELGHYFLHSRIGAQPIYIKREGTDRSEWEANWFAAGFLMPEQAFRAAWTELRGDADSVANRFGVSIDAAEIRAKALVV